jgi:hypothetical protein
LFCEFNRVASWNEGKTIILVRSSFQIQKIESLVSYSKSTNINVNMSFPNSNFEGYLSTYVFVKSFWHYQDPKIECWTSSLKLCEKKLNTFVNVDVRILVEKLNVYEGHIFPTPLLQTCRFETTSLCLNTRLLVNKIFPNSHNFYRN